MEPVSLVSRLLYGKGSFSSVRAVELTWTLCSVSRSLESPSCIRVFESRSLVMYRLFAPVFAIVAELRALTPIQFLRSSIFTEV